MRKLVQAWPFLCVARSGREPRYFPSESYLGEKEDVRWQLRFEHLSTFPWAPLPKPPIVTKPVLKGRAHVPQPLFWRVSCLSPLIEESKQIKTNFPIHAIYLLLLHHCIERCCGQRRQGGRSFPLLLLATQLLHGISSADWKGIDMTRWSDFTSMLRSESNHLAQSAKRSKTLWSWCSSLHRRPTFVHFQEQRGCGGISLGRRIRGWERWEITWFRKRRDGAGGCWESFNGCLSFFSSGYYESCNMKALQNTYLCIAYFILTNHNCVWAMV